MEIFQTIWNALITPNETLANIVSFPLIFVELPLFVLLFTTFLNFETTKRQNTICILVFCAAGVITKLLIPSPFGQFINMVIMPVTIILVYKVGVIKAIFSTIFPFMITAMLNSIIVKPYIIIFNISYINSLIIPLHRLAIQILILFSKFILSVLSRRYNFNTSIFENVNKKNKKLIIANSILGILSITIQFYLINYYTDTLPILVTFLSTLLLFTYFLITLYNLTNTTKLEIATRDLEKEKTYNKTLEILHDNIRAFKHDFNNIVQTIGRICFYRRHARIEKILFRTIRRLPAC